MASSVRNLVAPEIGIANLPNQRNKIVSQKGARFTIMLAGESGLGKTTFLNTLFTVPFKKPFDNSERHTFQSQRTVEIEMHHATLEERNFRVDLTVIDTPGLGDFVSNIGCWEPLIEFIDDQHESYMRQEQQPRREEKQDVRVHACLYFIRPTGLHLKPFDALAMKALCQKVNLIPVIAKGDSLTRRDMERFKMNLRAGFDQHGIEVFHPIIDDSDERAAELTHQLIQTMPFSVIGADQPFDTDPKKKGRQYPWGFVEVENEDHCDFVKLRNLLIRYHMLDLINTTDEKHYDRYRLQQLETRKFGEPKAVKVDNAKFKEEEEALRRQFTEQVKAEEARFRSWEQRLISERDRLNQDLESCHSGIKKLEKEIETLQATTVSEKSKKR